MKLFDDIYLVAGAELDSDPGDANTYLIDGGQKLVLIDSGGGYNVEGLYREMGKDGFDKSHIDMIINTHCHFDHTGGNYQIRKDTGCKTAIHETEVEAIEKDTELTVSDLWGHDLTPCPVDRELKGNEELAVGKHILKLVHVPGHSPGSTVITMEQAGKKMVFIGDCLALLNLPGESKSDLRSSLQKLIEMEPDVLLTGHEGPIVTNPKEFLKEHLDIVL